jgi:hypothetical protein
MQITTIGLDAKNAFKVHGIDASENVVVRKQLQRGQMMTFFKALPACSAEAPNCEPQGHNSLANAGIFNDYVGAQQDRGWHGHQGAFAAVSPSKFHKRPGREAHPALSQAEYDPGDDPVVRSTPRAPRPPQGDFACDGSRRQGDRKRQRV